jgi:hypothetical protein
MKNIKIANCAVNGANFSYADLTGAQFINVSFSSLQEKMFAANPEAAAKLTDALFQDVAGLTPEQIARCVDKGAKFVPDLKIHKRDSNTQDE